MASGGGGSHPDWYLNLVASPNQAAIEIQRNEVTPVTAVVLDGDERERAWESIVEEQPRYEKYQRRRERTYPLIRLSEG